MTDLDELIVDELPAGSTSAGFQKLAVRIDLLENEEKIDSVDTVTAGGVDFDANAASRSSLNLTIVDDGTLGWAPTSPDSPLAPYGNEIQAFRGIEFQDRIELVSLGIFQIQRPSASDSPQGISISLSGPDRSIRFIDAAFEEDGQIASGTEVDAAITSVLQEAWSDVPLDLAATSVQLPLLAYSEGEDRWAFAQGMAMSIGAELYFDRNGTCVMRPIPSAGQGDPVATIAEGEGGALLGAEREWDRGRIYNRVILTGENPNVSGTPPRAVATDNNPLSPTYYDGPFGKKPKFYSNQFISTTAQAQDAANGLLARVIGAPDTISFSGLVDPGRDPSDVIRITRERLGINEDHIIDTLSIPLEASGEMGGTTRVAQEFS